MCETTLGNFTYHILFIYILVTPILRAAYYFVVEIVSDWNVGRLEDTYNGLNYNSYDLYWSYAQNLILWLSFYCSYKDSCLLV